MKGIKQTGQDERPVKSIDKAYREKQMAELQIKTDNDLVTYLNDNPNELENVQVDGVDRKDYPDFCDAYISAADFLGVELEDEIIERLECGELVNELAHDSFC